MKHKSIITALICACVTFLSITLPSCSDDDCKDLVIGGDWPRPCCLNIIEQVDANNVVVTVMENAIHPMGGEFSFKLAPGDLKYYHKAFPKAKASELDAQIQDFYLNSHIEKIECSNGVTSYLVERDDSTWAFDELGIEIHKVIEDGVVYLLLTIPPMEDVGNSRQYTLYFATDHEKCSDKNCPICSIYTNNRIKFDQVSPSAWDNLFSDSDRDLFYRNTHVFPANK